MRFADPTPTMKTKVCLLLAAALPILGQAADPSSERVRTSAPEELPTLIVTAAAHEQPISNAPYSVEKVERRRLDELQSQSFPEALREIPGVFIQQTAHGQGSPYIRGFTGFRNLALIDGIRLNNSVFRDGPNQYWSTIDPYSLNAVELVKGQGSVLYGSDAVGGVVNAITAGPVYLEPEPPAALSGKGGKAVNPVAPQISPYVTGAASVRYATAENSWTGRVEGSVSKWKQYGFHLGLTGAAFGDLHAADLGDLSHTGYDEMGVDAEFEWYLSDDVKLTIAHNQFHQDDVWRTHRTIYAVPYSGSSVGTDLEHYFDQDRYLSYIRLEGDADGAVDHFRVTVSHHRQGEDLHRTLADHSRRLESFDVDTWGIEAVMESESAIGHLTYGLSYYLDFVDSSATKFSASGVASPQIQGPVGDASRYHLASAFIQDEITLTDRLDLTVGGRYTYAAAEVGRFANPETGKPDSLDEDWHDFSGSARLLFKADDSGKLKFFTGVSQSFRAPNLSDLSRFDTARSNEIETAAPGLDPEKYLSGEVGVRWDHAKTSFSLAYFYTDISDMIVRAPTGRTIDDLLEVTKLNAGDGHVQGIEFSGIWQFHRDWRLQGSIAWQDGQVDGYPNSTTEQETEPLSRLLPITGLVGLRWDSPSRRFWAEGNVQIVDRQDRLSASDERDTQRIPPGGTPGYVVGTLRAGWHVNDRLTLTAGVENFTEEDYRIHGSGVNEPGVNFVFGAQMRF